MADEKDNNDLAKDRTDWAEDRTLLASERTYASWTGTGLGCLGLAIGLQSVFGALDPTWLARLIATGFSLVAATFFFAAWKNSRQMRKRLESHTAETLERTYQTLLTCFLVAGAAATILILWVV